MAWALAFLALLPACSAKEAGGSQWDEGNRIGFRFGVQEEASEYDFEFCENGDLRLRFGEDAGELILLSGQVMLTRGLDLIPGMEGDILDEAFLMLQLTARLLRKAFPNGPSAVGSREGVELLNQEQGIRLATPGASGGIDAPWSLTGSASRQGDSIRFELFLVSGGGDPEHPAQISGTWRKDPIPQRIDDDLNVEGWQVFGLGVRSEQTEGETAIDFGATKKKPARTVGAIRESLALGTPTAGS